MIPQVPVASLLLAGEDVNLMTTPRQFPAQLTDVDVHAPGFLAPQSGQRTGMDTDHGDPQTLRMLGHTRFGSTPDCKAVNGGRLRPQPILVLLVSLQEVVFPESPLDGLLDAVRQKDYACAESGEILHIQP